MCVLRFIGPASSMAHFLWNAGMPFVFTCLKSTLLCKGFGKPVGSYPLKVLWEEIHSPNENDPPIAYSYPFCLMSQGSVGGCN
jgi:hypothetical protein